MSEAIPITAVGSYADANAANYVNSSCFGNTATITASNQIRIGNSSVTSIGGYANWSNISDGRYKKNIKEEAHGLDFILKLRPITYNLDITGIENHLHPSQKSFDQQSIQSKEQVVYSGFIAQDVEKAANEIGYNFSGVDAPKNDQDFYGLRYSDFVVPLVKAVQELSTENDSKNQQIASLQSQIDELKVIVNQLQAQGSSESSRATGSETIAAHLEQNIPNPFSKSTQIHFYVPQNVTKAILVITDASGKIVKSFDNLSKGFGSVTIPVDELTSGTYGYALIVDNQKVDSKQMVITR